MFLKRPEGRFRLPFLHETDWDCKENVNLCTLTGEYNHSSSSCRDNPILLTSFLHNLPTFKRYFITNACNGSWKQKKSVQFKFLTLGG